MSLFSGGDSATSELEQMLCNSNCELFERQKGSVSISMCGSEQVVNGRVGGQRLWKETFPHLKTSLSKKLIGESEWHLDDSGEFGHFLCSVVLDVCNTLT